MKRLRERELELSTLRVRLVVEEYESNDPLRIEQIKHEVQEIDRELSKVRLELYMKQG